MEILIFTPGKDNQRLGINQINQEKKNIVRKFWRLDCNALKEDISFYFTKV
jgi:hypothetical protein